MLILMDADTSVAGARGAIEIAGAGDGEADSGHSFRELVFRERHAWIQVLADENDAVARFSITVTDPRFRFSVRDLTWGRLPVRLGHSRFSDVHPDLSPQGRSLRIGATTMSTPRPTGSATPATTSIT